MMNAIAAHKDELKKLLEKLSGDIADSGITFVALLDAYITRLDANCPDISARVDPQLAQINRGINVHPNSSAALPGQQRLSEGRQEIDRENDRLCFARSGR